MGSAPSSTSATSERVGPEARGREAAAPAWDDMVVVGRVARTHGLRGHLVVAPETDFVEERFAPGATLWTRRGGGPGRGRFAGAGRRGGGRGVGGGGGGDGEGRL